MKYNKGEWSEAYAFVKLIGDGKVYASDENLNKNIEKTYPILKVFKDEIERYYANNPEDSVVDIIDFEGNILNSMDSKSFIDIANKTLSIIKENKGRSFEIPEMESFLNKLGIYSFKGSSNKKEDIKMEIQDLIMDRSDIFTFSIKSELGSKATLLNASKSTNFTFKIDGISKEDMERLNNINKEVNKKWLKTKFNEIFNNFKLGNYSISL